MGTLRAMRLIWFVTWFNVRMLLTSEFFILTTFLTPLIFATLAFFLFKAGGATEGQTLLYVALGSGMMGLGCRLAKRLNQVARHTGPVFADRYHARVLATPREVRNAIRYVLLNALKHADADPIPDLGTEVIDGIDPCSSAPWFDGWQRPPPPLPNSPVAAPRTWLLRSGWRSHGLLLRR